MTGFEPGPYFLDSHFAMDNIFFLTLSNSDYIRYELSREKLTEVVDIGRDLNPGVHKSSQNPTGFDPGIRTQNNLKSERIYSPLQSDCPKSMERFQIQSKSNGDTMLTVPYLMDSQNPMRF